MKHAIWGYLFIALGIVIIAIMMLVHNLTSTSEEDYYLAKEIMEASMRDAVDSATYLTTGEVIMSREKFVEVFLRRFAESVTPNKEYDIDFYQIYENPPAATVRIRSTTGTTNIKDNPINVNVDTLISAILVAGYDFDSDSFEFRILDNYKDSNISIDKRNNAIGKYINSPSSTGKAKEDDVEIDKNKDGLLDLEDLSIIEIILYKGYKIGDVNKDGKVDKDDVTMCKNYSPNSANYDKLSELLIDINNSMKVNTTKDCNELSKFVEGKRGIMNQIAVGDVNSDGIINVLDAYDLDNLIKREEKLVKKNNGRYEPFMRASEDRINTLDTNKDGKINEADIVNILTYVSKGTNFDTNNRTGMYKNLKTGVYYYPEG